MMKYVDKFDKVLDLVMPYASVIGLLYVLVH